MAAKKSFKDQMDQRSTAAASYITEEISEPVQEYKTRRLNLLMRPSTYEKMTKIATMRRISFNDLIHQISEQCIEDNADLIRKYDEVFGE